jgi:hypothetical protein
MQPEMLIVALVHTEHPAGRLIVKLRISFLALEIIQLDGLGPL